MHVADPSDYHLFITLATILFLAIGIAINRDNLIGIVIKTLSFCMVGFGFILMIGIYSA